MNRKNVAFDEKRKTYSRAYFWRNN
jgi:hypothetical protein